MEKTQQFSIFFASLKFDFISSAEYLILIAEIGLVLLSLLEWFIEHVTKSFSEEISTTPMHTIVFRLNPRTWRLASITFTVEEAIVPTSVL